MVTRSDIMGVPAAPELTTRADCALTRVCRLAAVVKRRSAQPAEMIKFESAVAHWVSCGMAVSCLMTDYTKLFTLSNLIPELILLPLGVPVSANFRKGGLL